MTGSTGADVRAGRENAQAEIPGCRGRRRDPGREWSRVRTTKAREEGFQAGSAGAVQAAGAESLQEFPPDCSLSRGNKRQSLRRRSGPGRALAVQGVRRGNAGAGRGVREDLGTRWGGLR